MPSISYPCFTIFVRLFHNTPGEFITVYAGYDAALHMNWGWDSFYNGWYGA